MCLPSFNWQSFFEKEKLNTTTIVILIYKASVLSQVYAEAKIIIY